jgi:hypothetical protein
MSFEVILLNLQLLLNFSQSDLWYDPWAFELPVHQIVFSAVSLLEAEERFGVQPLFWFWQWQYLGNLNKILLYYFTVWNNLTLKIKSGLLSRYNNINWVVIKISFVFRQHLRQIPSFNLLFLLRQQIVLRLKITVLRNIILLTLVQFTIFKYQVVNREEILVPR